MSETRASLQQYTEAQLRSSLSSNPNAHLTTRDQLIDEYLRLQEIIAYNEDAIKSKIEGIVRGFLSAVKGKSGSMMKPIAHDYWNKLSPLGIRTLNSGALLYGFNPNKASDADIKRTVDKIYDLIIEKTALDNYDRAQLQTVFGLLLKNPDEYQIRLPGHLELISEVLLKAGISENEYLSILDELWRSPRTDEDVKNAIEKLDKMALQKRARIRQFLMANPN